MKPKVGFLLLLLPVLLLLLLLLLLPVLLPPFVLRTCVLDSFPLRSPLSIPVTLLTHVVVDRRQAGTPGAQLALDRRVAPLLLRGAGGKGRGASLSLKEI